MPKLRFPGFEGEWENTELGNLVVYGKDKTRVTKNHYVSTENIEQDFRGIIPFEDAETIVDGTEFTKGDVLIANIRPYLKKVWQSNMYGACNADVLVMKPQEIDNDFLYNLIAQNRFIDYVMGGVKGSKMPRGDKAHILQYNTAVPSIVEQRQIARFLSLLSNRITMQKKLIETLKKYKRGAIIHALTHKSAKYSATSTWVEKTLADLCCEFRSGRNISATLIHGTGEYPVYGGNGIRGYCDKYSHDGEYVVIGRQGALCGNVRLIQGQNYLSEHAIAVKANTENDTKFLLYLLDFMRLGQYSDQGAQPGLAVNKLLKLKCTVPDKKSQAKIAAFLLNLDAQISVHEMILSCLCNQQKALLQQLFI